MGSFSDISGCLPTIEPEGSHVANTSCNSINSQRLGQVLIFDPEALALQASNELSRSEIPADEAAPLLGSESQLVTFVS